MNDQHLPHGVESVSLFGSYAKGLADVGSDVDLKIDKGALRCSLFQLCGFRLAVEDALNLPVDLVTSDSFDKSFLDMIQEEKVLLYRDSWPAYFAKNRPLLSAHCR